MVAVARLRKTADSFDATGANLQQKPFLLLLFTYWPLKKVKVKLPIRDRGPFSDAASFVGGDEDWCEPVSDQISGERDQEVHQRTTHSTFLTHFINFAMKEML